MTITYNFLGTRSYQWDTAATSGTVLSAAATILYAALLLWRNRGNARKRRPAAAQRYSDQSYYTNYIPNMYPSAVRTTSPQAVDPPNDDDRVNQQMALLLMQRDATSPGMNSSTYRIDLPEDREEQERFETSQELVGTPKPSHAGWSRDRANSRPDSLGENQAWQQLQDRGRKQHRPSSTDLRTNHSRGLSREERRREIELGRA